jgi:hypothetical protein
MRFWTTLLALGRAAALLKVLRWRSLRRQLRNYGSRARRGSRPGRGAGGRSSWRQARSRTSGPWRAWDTSARPASDRQSVASGARYPGSPAVRTRPERGRDCLGLRHVLPLTKVLDWHKQRRMWRGLYGQGLNVAATGRKRGVVLATRFGDFAADGLCRTSQPA